MASRYAQYQNHTKTRIGETLVLRCTAGMLNEAVLSIIQQGGKLRSVAEKRRSILVAIFDYAISHEIVPNNSAKGIASMEYRAPQPKIWSTVAIHNIRSALRHWKDKPPTKSVSIADVIDLTLATASRISEVLAFACLHGKTSICRQKTTSPAECTAARQWFGVKVSQTTWVIRR